MNNLSAFLLKLGMAFIKQAAIKETPAAIALGKALESTFISCEGILLNHVSPEEKPVLWAGQIDTLKECLGIAEEEAVSILSDIPGLLVEMASSEITTALGF